MTYENQHIILYRRQSTRFVEGYRFERLGLFLELKVGVLRPILWYIVRRGALRRILTAANIATLRASPKGSINFTIQIFIYLPMW